MKMYNLSIEDVNSSANETKNSLFRALERDGVIEKGMSEKLCGRYVVIWKQKGFFGALWDKLHKIDDNTWEVAVLKLV